MTRALLVALALVAWAGLIAGSLIFLTPDEEAAIGAAASSELEATTRALGLAAAEMQREQLAAVREATSVLRPGLLLERGESAVEAPAKGKKKAPKSAEPKPTPEQQQDAMRTLEAELTEALLPSGSARWLALVNHAGEVVLASGEGGWALGTSMKNHPLVVDGLLGLSRAAALNAPKPWLLTAAPTFAREGGANGTLVLARAVDAAFCHELSAAVAQAPLALSRAGQLACKTDSLGMSAPAPGLTVVPQPLEAPLLFVDASHIGSAVLSTEHAVGVLDLTASVGRDLRPMYTRLSQWQQRVIAVWLAGLLPLAVLLVLAWLMAAAPAQAIANHLALLQQGSKVAPLSERKFSGGFRRIVKNLNTLFERKESRSGQALAPISQLLQQQGSGEISGEFKLDSIAQEKPPAPVVEKTREPEPEPEPPPVEPKPETRPPLAPLPSGLSALSDSIFDEERGATSKHAPIHRAPEPEAPAISKLNTLSESETDSGLSGLSGLGALSALPPPPEPPAPKMPYPPAPPVETPWPESTVASAPAMPSVPADPDEAHFQEVFNQFLKVREQCGEPTNNLTYDKFVEKLKKSREQVMQKQNTRSVRFQVYVKDGKAALKAVAAGRP